MVRTLQHKKKKKKRKKEEEKVETRKEQRRVLFRSTEVHVKSTVVV